jgi:two-component system cell cycle sensor histidine kinase/response regulator CckA
MAKKSRDKAYPELFDFIDDIYYRVDKSGLIEVISPAVTKYGYQQTELIGKEVTELFVKPEERTKILEAYALRGCINDFEFSVKSKLGTEIVVSLSGRALQDPRGEMMGAEGIIRDITYRKSLERNLRESEERYRIFFENAPFPMWVIDSETFRFLAVNHAAMNHYGYSLEEFLSMEIRHIRPPEDVPLLEDRLQKIPFHSHPGLRRQGSWRHRTKDGKIIHVEISGVDFLYENRKATLVVANDITERTYAERALRESEKKYRNLVENTPALICTHDFEGYLITVNPAGLELFGLLPSQMLRHKLESFLAPSVRHLFPDYLRRIRERRNDQGMMRITTSKNEERMLLYRNVVIQEPGKEPYVLGLAQDMTEQFLANEALRQTELALRKSEEKYRALFEETKDMVFITTPDGKFIDINPAGVDLLGFSSKQNALHTKVEDLYLDPDLRRIYSEIMAREGSMKDFEIEVRRKDGKKLIMLETSAAVRDTDGKIVAYRGIARDITKLKELQDQLLQAQKMETVGLLAGGVAHDFNNSLMAITAYCDLLQLRYGSNESLVEDVRKILKATEKASALTLQLLAFGRRQVLRPKHLNLNDIVRTLEKNLRSVLRDDIDLVVDLAADLGFVQADPGQVEHVIMNLCVNAVDAMPDAGTFCIRTKNVDVEPSNRAQNFGLPAGSYILMVISDTGLGMTEEVQSHVFEPFFTTKEFGASSGLGLSTVYGIIKQSGGHIQVKSRIGEGTRFFIYLNRLELRPEIPRVKGSSIRYPCTILLVDDNDTVREVLGKLLRSSGYSVLEAAGGQDALAISNSVSIIDLLVTDVVMPVMKGWKLAQLLQEKFPNLKCIFLSGHARETAVGSTQIPPGSLFLQKPISLETILKNIDSLMA